MKINQERRSKVEISANDYIIGINCTYELETIIFGINQQNIAKVKKRLKKDIGQDAAVLLQKENETTEKEKVNNILENEDIASIIVNPLSFLEKEKWTYFDLLKIMEALRGKNGCPWDRAQTHESIKMNIIEEAYEVLEAINLKDKDALIEETGDVFLQTVFHAEIAKEKGEYDISDVINRLCSKLIKRHTHIFGSDVALNATEAKESWDENKRKEKGHNNAVEAVNAIATTLPSLMQATKMIKKLINADIYFLDRTKICEKAENFAYNVYKETAKENIGEILFSVCEICAIYDINAEEALLELCEKLKSTL